MSPISRRTWSPLILSAALLLTITAVLAASTPIATTLTPEYALAHELTGEFGFLRLTVSDLTDDRLYTTENNSPILTVIDTQPAQVIRSVLLPRPVFLMALDPHGDRLYMAPADNNSRSIIALDTASLSAIDLLTYDCPAETDACHPSGLAVGPSGRIYLLFANQQRLLILDGQTGQSLHEMTFPAGAPESWRILGSALYTANRSGDYATVTLRRYDLSGVVPVLAAEAGLPEAHGFSYTPLLDVAPDGSFLIAYWRAALGQGTEHLVRLNPLSLGVELAYPTDPEASITDAFVAAESDEVVVIRHTVWPQIHVFDAADGSLRRIGFRFEHPYDELAFAPLSNNYLANLSQDRLVVLRPMNYATALPVVLSGFCGGLIVDDFSDPASGWPIADHGTRAYYYADEPHYGPHYAMLHRVPNIWSGVTRGDTWHEWHSLAALTTISSGVGTTGLVFGLNDDWSHFYSFEIIPELKRWVLYFYMDGWHIWATEEFDHIRDTGAYTSLRLKPRPDGQLDLQIESYTVFTFPEIPRGRVGLGGGSFNQGVGHRYDDYIIEPGPNCRPTTRSGHDNIERSPLLPPPPLPRPPGA